MTWAVFAAVAVLIMKPYVMLSASSTEAIQDAVTYGNIVCIGSIGGELDKGTSGTWEYAFADGSTDCRSSICDHLWADNGGSHIRLLLCRDYIPSTFLH